MKGSEFYERYQEIGLAVKRKGPVRPEVDLREWKQFVDGCVAGYDDNLAEYQGDLWIRRNIQLALDDEELRGMEGYSVFREAVGRVDEVFKSVATVAFPGRDPSGFAWWNLVVPRYGGEEFASDLRRECGVVIPVREG
ncbi:hypothetical protein [Streptomyces xylophagus]|uniref:hypothetical protein n=1 Tax=Streptomyces xylophagus TaxID=285514 RepID=UPI00131EA91A|nr:hypothetical protein [Streptomyces xylophagus]